MCSTTRKLGAFLMINAITACQQKKYWEIWEFCWSRIVPNLLIIMTLLSFLISYTCVQVHCFILNLLASGLEIWCVENQKLVSVPKPSHGRFFSGSAYLVLSVSCFKTLLISLPYHCYFRNNIPWTNSTSISWQ